MLHCMSENCYINGTIQSYSNTIKYLSRKPKERSDELQHSSAWTWKYICVSPSLTRQSILWKGISSLSFSFINTLYPLLRVAGSISSEQAETHSTVSSPSLQRLYNWYKTFYRNSTPIRIYTISSNQDPVSRLQTPVLGASALGLKACSKLLSETETHYFVLLHIPLPSRL